MVGGMFRGLNRENAMRFSFLLSTPVIFAAGAQGARSARAPWQPPPLRGRGRKRGRRRNVLFAVIFLSRYLKTRSLYPFAVYSVLFGAASVIRFGFF